MVTPRKALTLFPDESETGKADIRPPLKWAGGKRWQLSKLLPYWEPERHRRLVEPFCGGLAVTLGLMPSRALLNDINPHLINFYQQLKHGLISTLHQENKASVFYAHRRDFNIRTFFTSGGLAKYLSYSDRVEILTLEAFVARANSGKL